MESTSRISRIVSGAQTGADRAALDVALAFDLDCGGWVPKGRLAEDGRIPDRYPGLRETDDERPEVRTRLNVRDSDATLILFHAELRGGSALTHEVAIELGRPVLALDLASVPLGEALTSVREWLATVEPSTLNVAGPRASEDEKIHAATRRLLESLLAG